MKAKNLNFIFLITIIFISCKNNSFEGYRKLDKNVYYKLVKFGESERRPSEGDYVVSYLHLMNCSDSVIYKGIKQFKIEKNKNEIYECLKILSKDDCAIFILPVKKHLLSILDVSMPELIKNDKYFKLKIELLNIQTDEEFNKEKEAFVKWIENFNEYEKIILKQYIENSRLNVEPDSSGIYRLVIKKGNDKKVRNGSLVTVHYEGKFLNGKFFDSTKKRNQPFEFVYGTECQMIKGLYDAIGKMTEGEKDIVIIPSELAFGEKGSSTGIIPPYTSLVFEVEILSIK